MIAILTDAAWSSVQIELDNGVDPAETWTPSAGVTDAYSAAEDLVAWVNATFGGEAATWAWSQTGDAPDMTITTLNAYDWTANAAAQSVLGCDAVASGVDQTWVAPSGVVTMQQTPAGDSTFAAVAQQSAHAGVNVPAASGGAVGGLPSLSGIDVRIAWSSTRAMLEYQRQAVAAASHPRRAYVHFAASAAWALVELPTIDTRSLGNIYASSVDVVVSV